MLFCCLRCNIEASCHKYFVDVSSVQQTTPLTTSGSVTTCHGSAAACWQHLATVTASGSEVRYWLGIAISAYPTCVRSPRWGGGGSHSNIAMLFGTKKLEWLGYLMVKTFWRYIYSFWHNSRTWQTQTDTAWRRRPCLCTALRGKN